LFSDGPVCPTAANKLAFKIDLDRSAAATDGLPGASTHRDAFGEIIAANISFTVLSCNIVSGGTGV